MINHYDKVYEPVKAKAKELPKKLKSRRDRDYEDEEYIEYDRYEGPRRDSGRRDRRRGGSDYSEEKYERRDSGRARSAGRDGYGGRGLRDDRRRRGEFWTPRQSK